VIPAHTLAEANARIVELEAQLARMSELEKLLTESTARLSLFEARIRELEARLNQNSSNSSRPPSSDFPKGGAASKPPKTKKRRSRKRGGQAGHARKSFEPLPPDRVEQVIDCKPEKCRHCGEALTGEDVHPQCHQIIELPPVIVKAIEYRLHRLLCLKCGTTTSGLLPFGVPWGNYGPRLMAFVAMLTGMCRLSKRLVQGLLLDAFGLKMSLGAICKQERLASEAMAAPVAEAHEYVKKQHRACADETGWRERMKKAWLWVAVTSMVTVFLIRRSRGSGAAKELLGDDFAGILNSDRWHGYTWVGEHQRQLCWSHLMRQFIGFEDFGPAAKRLGRRLQKQTRQMFALWHRLRDGKLTRRGFKRAMKPIEAEIVRLLHRGECCPALKVAGRCREILVLEQALFTFVHHENVEPTNNAAERAIRHAVIWRKVSLGTDSERGSRFVERILTVTATLRSQNRNVLQWLTEAGVAMLKKTKPPTLLPIITLGKVDSLQAAA